MVIFHSYVSLPEGNDMAKVGKMEKNTKKWVCRGNQAGYLKNTGGKWWEFKRQDWL